jgi:hypothetical protein
MMALLQHAFCPECWAGVFALIAVVPFLKPWASRMRAKLMAKHAKGCEGDACHHDHEQEDEHAIQDSSHES